jgi:hypothetical protein
MLDTTMYSIDSLQYIYGLVNKICNKIFHAELPINIGKFSMQKLILSV